MNSRRPKLKGLPINTNELIYFISFYVISTLLFYTASWISWGAFEDGHPSYFNLQEFFASGGTQFIVSFLITIPIWYAVSVVLKRTSLKNRLLSHLFFLPVYVITSYFLLKVIVESFGWSMYWGGYKVVWTLYMFTLFYIIQFSIIHGYSYFKKYQKELKDKAQLKEAVLQSEIKALKSQLNPHFLHNLFNSINASIPPENESTRELIIQLSDLFRYQNTASQNEFVTIKEELDFLTSYLQLMKIRLKERLNILIEVPAELFADKIAPMLLQPLVENAVNHGIATKVEPSTLLIKIEKIKGRLHYTIADTGTGIPDKAKAFSNGIGLANTQMRLEKIYNSKLIIEDLEPSGTKISFVL